MSLTEECIMATTAEEKRGLVKRYLTPSQYHYVDDIVSWLDAVDDGFRRSWYSATTVITAHELNSDPCVSPLDALSDIIRKYREQGYTEIPLISWEGIHVTGRFLETEEQFFQRLKELIRAWLTTHETDEAKIREKIAQHEREIERLKAKLNN